MKPPVRTRRRDAHHIVERNCLEALVCSAFAVHRGDFRHRTRSRAQTALARQIAIYLAHVVFGLTFAEAGRTFGRDRTTAAHACRVVEERRDDNRLDCIVERLGSAARRWVESARADAVHGHG